MINNIINILINNYIMTTKYFFACVKYKYSSFDGYKKSESSNVFTLDHYPRKDEIMTNIVGDYEDNGYIDCQIISYNELTEEAYYAYY